MSDVWSNWTAREKCIVSAEVILDEKPEGLSYQGLSEYGVHYYRKSDDSFWIETRNTKGVVVWVKV